MLRSRSGVLQRLTGQGGDSRYCFELVLTTGPLCSLREKRSDSRPLQQSGRLRDSTGPILYSRESWPLRSAPSLSNSFPSPTQATPDAGGTCRMPPPPSQISAGYWTKSEYFG